MTDLMLFTTGRPEFLYDCSCTVLETYNFGDDVGAAAYVRTDDSHASIKTWDERIKSVEENLDIGIPTAPEATSEAKQETATIEDVRKLHNVPTDSASGKGQTVVAMDSGVDPSHPVFSDDSIKQVDVTGSGKGDEVGHGTAVLGQITRLAPESELISLRIFGDQGKTKTNVIMRAYEWLHNHTDEYDVVNMSWGASQPSEQIDRVHNKLVEKGVRDVVAAGNSGGKSGSPATAERAFSVGACTEAGKMAEFSSYNPELDNPDVTAIGKDNRLAQAKGTTMGEQLSGPWVKASGTSFSSPEVAGMVAKYRTKNPKVKPKQIMQVFEEHARDIKDQPKDGAGLVDYGATVGKKPPNGDGDGKWPTTEATVEQSSEGTEITLGADWVAPGDYDVTRLSETASETILHFSPADSADE
ncbi:S8 family serine peptidase [Haladaptatus sp. GCM10025707]|uniref:S8 family peptidase n=1 Tax=unclassified Haladaptatus TaxID=2622732 RepID=UPI0023E7CC6F|nr:MULTISPECIES: S8 family serine peptidase [unclassified Haladaptatus]